MYIEGVWTEFEIKMRFPRQSWKIEFRQIHENNQNRFFCGMF